ncbi:hypothetical protein GW17_00051338 [Ensete ventricosum]|nr:hypothetical protein GW17_00051338 [Ensete ventricosum]RZS00611.1 hypothetical protein BHM03_00030364 [Ensete ventricosum]
MGGPPTQGGSHPHRAVSQSAASECDTCKRCRLHTWQCLLRACRRREGTTRACRAAPQ